SQVMAPPGGLSSNPTAPVTPSLLQWQFARYHSALWQDDTWHCIGLLQDTDGLQPSAKASALLRNPRAMKRRRSSARGLRAERAPSAVDRPRFEGVHR